MSDQRALNRMAKLISDPGFLELEQSARRASMFTIVGRTHEETWHSMFLGWLLDPGASHGLGAYPLRRFLTALSDPLLVSSTLPQSDLDRIALASNLDAVSIWPSEANPVEKKPHGTKKRLDVFAEGIQVTDISGNKRDVVLVVEMKIGNPINQQQCSEYANLIELEYPDAIRLFVIIAPTDSFMATALETFGDARWAAIDFQILHDQVVAPCLKISTLHVDYVRLVEEYLLALRVSHKGRRLAVTESERSIARQLWEDYRDVFETISTALADEPNAPDLSGISKEPLRVTADGEVIQGDTVPEFLESLAQFIERNWEACRDYIPHRRPAGSMVILGEIGSDECSEQETDRFYRDYGRLRVYVNLDRKNALGVASNFLIRCGFSTESGA